MKALVLSAFAALFLFEGSQSTDGAMWGALVMWLVSSAFSTMPPLPDGAGYFARWAYALAQLLAANPQQIGSLFHGRNKPGSTGGSSAA